MTVWETVITKVSDFLVTLLLILNILLFGIWPASECARHRTIVCLMNLDLTEIPQVSKEYLPGSPSSALFTSKSKPQISSWLDRLLLESLFRKRWRVSHLLLDGFFHPPAILKLVSTTVLRC